MNKVFSNQNTNTNLNRFLTKTYGIMGIAVLISAMSAYLGTRIPALVMNSTFAIGSCIFCIIMAFFFGKLTIKNSALGATLLVVYSVLIGFSLSDLVYAYTQRTLTGAFISASAIFIGMAFLGATTKIDLSSFYTYALVGLIGIILVSLVNIIFFKNSGLSFILSIASVILFTGFTAMDAQNAMHDYEHLSLYGISENSIAIINAFNLYLDFVNIFVDLVEIFGDLSNN